MACGKDQSKGCHKSDAAFFSRIGFRCLCSLSSAGTADEKCDIVVLLVAVAVYTYRRKDWGDVSAVKQLGLAALLGSVVMAFGIGFYDGFFGPGTGSFLIFGFLFLGYDFVTAAGNAKALNFASGIGALLSFTLSGSVLWTYGLLMGFAMVIGAYFGSRMAIRHGASYVKPLYLIVTTLLIGKQVYELLFK